MKVEAGASLPVREEAGWWDWRIILRPLARLPVRLRDRRFWNVQAMILVATVPHYLVEEVGFTNPSEAVHGLAITLYVIPLLYAALTFGWEGAILTALWATALTSPSIWLWHRSGFHWLGEVGQLAITLPVGLMVAWRVDLESRLRARAERTSAGLALLNEIAERLGHRLEVEEALPAAVRSLRQGLRVEVVWLCLEPEVPGGSLQVILDPPGRWSALATLPVDALHKLAAARRESLVVEEGAVAVPLMTEGGILGSLGALAPGGAALNEEQLRLLATAGQQIRVATENARLYRQRQESLQSYVRQVTQAQEDERLRIARELHDETAQELVHLVRKLEDLGEAANGAVSGPVEGLLTLARGTLRSVRRFSRDLRPSVLDDLGLVPAIELAVENVKARLAGGAEVIVSGEARRLDPPVELALFRITQEALHNVEKHAQATSVVVSLRFTSDSVSLEVGDDGNGCDVPTNVSDLARTGKLGILGMKERAELVGGSFRLQSVPGSGCRVTVEVAAPSADGSPAPAGERSRG